MKQKKEQNRRVYYHLFKIKKKTQKTAQKRVESYKKKHSK